jgi:hypothetical protein
VTGLNLEPFLRLLRADLGVWISIAAVILGLAALAWTCRGSRRALRKCLVLSIGVHVGLVLYGAGFGRSSTGAESGDEPIERIQSIQIVGEDGSNNADRPPAFGAGGRTVEAWGRPRDLAGLKDDPLRVNKVALGATPPAIRMVAERVAAPSAAAPDLKIAEPSTNDESPISEPTAEPIASAPARSDEIPEATPVTSVPSPNGVEVSPIRVRPARSTTNPSRGPKALLTDRPKISAPEPSPPAASVPLTDDPSLLATNDRPAPDRGADPSIEPQGIGGLGNPTPLPEGDLRSRVRNQAGSSGSRVRPSMTPVTIARGPNPGSATALFTPVNRPVAEVPEVYRERVDPERVLRAKKAGATEASEKAVDLALDWLARHQDADGRWNAGTKKYRTDDAPIANERNFTIHCPPGEVCSGECFYYEADTAMTGLALLAYLGAGHTHTKTDGKYAPVVAKGLQFLLSIQAEDGDLRGESRAVGMYCHAMSTLALCEAYALSGDERLRDPTQRAVDFLGKSRALDGLSWRYKPGDPSGDTSLLGWAILVQKSADEVGLNVPPTMRSGALGWLKLVAAGQDRGLAVYRPNEGPYGGTAGYVPGRNMTPTMTAEAWVCRQFLGVGGPGAASDEAARYLLQNRPERDKLNLYYWYYGTLAMRQRGGDDWSRWNPSVRDELISLQKASGHQSGSWDPSDSRSNYDARGGRIYCTALAAMTLEVYYRYGKLNDEKPSRIAPRSDSTLRRTGDK